MTTQRPLNFLFATWEGGGSVAPALTVVRKLVARGHRVRVMSDRCNRAEAEAAGAVFAPWTRAPSRAEKTRESDPVKDWAADSPPEGLIQAMLAVWTGPALAYAQDVTEELAREPADLVVSSEMLFGVAAGCEALGQKLALLAVNISLFPIPGVPPMGPGLPPARTEEERELHAAITQATLEMFGQGLVPLNVAREALGLKPLATLPDQVQAAERLLLATSPAFDFAPEVLPDHIRYVGPQLGEPSWAEPWTSPWAPDDARPLVLVSFSTTFQNQAGLLQRVADALAGLPVRGLITLGGSIRRDELTAPANVHLADSAPHDELMRQAALVVTHGGHGTVVRALTHRRPMLVFPQGRDQNDNAVRVTARGAGLALAPDAGVEEITAALRRLLDEPDFARAAARLGQAVAVDTKISPVVEELEALARQPARQPAPELCPG